MTGLETEQPINRKKVEELYHKYIALAMDAQKKEDRVLSESHYQRAEHCLYLMNEGSISTSARTSFSLGKRLSPVKKVIEDAGLKRTFNKKVFYQQLNNPTEEAASTSGTVILPFRGSYLRRSRRKFQLE